MSRGTLLLVIGLLIALSPFLGLPYTWLMILLPLLGLVSTALAYTIRSHRAPKTYEEGTDAQ